MKISIVTPVYNEDQNIHRYFEAIKKMEYPKDDLELIFVNDASKDTSLKMLEEIGEKSDYNIRIINFEKNYGRAIAREEGAKAAKYEQIFFLDCKCEIFHDALQKFKEKKYEMINCQILQKDNHIFDKFFLMIRRKVYGMNFKKNLPDAYITKENFNHMPKGTTALFCDKTTFLNSQPDNKHDQLGSDDTKLLWNIIQKKNILKTSDIKVWYNTRKSLKDNIFHIFDRGNKFVDYYHSPGKRYFNLINFSILVFPAIAYLLVKGLFIKELILIFLTLDGILAIYLARDIKDFFIAFTLFPFFGTIFFAGVLKKVISKIWR